MILELCKALGMIASPELLVLPSPVFYQHVFKVLLRAYYACRLAF